MRTLEDRVAELEGRVLLLEHRAEAASRSVPSHGSQRVVKAYSEPLPLAPPVRTARSGGTPNPTPSERAPKGQGPRKDQINDDFGSKTLPFVGALILLGGIFFGISYLASERLLTPQMLFWAEVAASLLVFGGGLLLQAKEKPYFQLIQGVGGSGLLMSYVAGAYIHKVLPEAVCWPLTLATAAGVMLLGAFQNGRGLVWVGGLGLLLASFLAPDSVGPWITLLACAATVPAFVHLRHLKDMGGYGVLAFGVVVLALLDQNSVALDASMAASALTLLPFLAGGLWGRVLDKEYDSAGWGPLLCGLWALSTLCRPDWTSCLALLVFGLGFMLLAWWSPKGMPRTTALAVGGVLAFLIAPWGFPGAWAWSMEGGEWVRSAVFTLVAAATTALLIGTKKAAWAGFIFPSALFAAATTPSGLLAPNSSVWGPSGAMAILPLTMHLVLAAAFIVLGLGTAGIRHSALIQFVAPLPLSWAAGSIAAGLTPRAGASDFLTFSIGSLALVGLASVAAGELRKENGLAWGGSMALAGTLLLLAISIFPPGKDTSAYLGYPAPANPVIEWILLIGLTLLAMPLVWWGKERERQEWQTLVSLLGLSAFWLLLEKLLPGQLTLMMTLAMSGYALALLALGFHPRLSILRALAYLVLTGAVFKLVFVDTAVLPPGARAVAYLVLGTALLGGGWLVVWARRRTSKAGEDTQGSLQED